MNDVKIFFHMFYSSGSLILTLFHITVAIALFINKHQKKTSNNLAIIFLLIAVKFSMVFACYLIYRKWTLITVPLMLFFAILSIIYMNILVINYLQKSKNKKNLLTIIEFSIFIMAILYFTYTLFSMDIVFNFLVHTYKFYIPAPPFTIDNSIIAFLIGFFGIFFIFFIAPGAGTLLLTLAGWYFVIFIIISFKKTKDLDTSEKMPLRFSAISLVLINLTVSALNFVSETRLIQRDIYELIFVSFHLLAALSVFYFFRKVLKLDKQIEKIIFFLASIFFVIHVFSNYYQKNLDNEFDKIYTQKSKEAALIMFDKLSLKNVEYIATIDRIKDNKIKKILLSKNKELKFIKSTSGDEKNRTYRSSNNKNYIAYKLNDINSKNIYEVGFRYSDYRLFIHNKMSLLAYFLIFITIASVILITFYQKRNSKEHSGF